MSSTILSLVAEENLMNDRQILGENVRSLDVLFLFREDPLEGLRWCARRRLIRNSLVCSACGQVCSLQRRTGSIDSYVWRCPQCRSKMSVRVSSIFQRVKLKIGDIIHCLYDWCKKIPARYTAEQIRAGVTLLPRLHKIFSALCRLSVKPESRKLGGVSETGEPLTVEVSQFLFKRSKRRTDGPPLKRWLVLGLYERDTKRCHVERVTRSDSVVPAIEKVVKNGSRIITEDRQAYDELATSVDRTYVHVTVPGRFASDAADKNVHLNNLECLWGRAKTLYNSRGGVKDHLFDDFLCEIMWRSQVGTSTFQRIIIAARVVDA